VTYATIIVRSAAAKIDKMLAAQIAKKLALILRMAVQQVRRSRTGAALLKGIETSARSMGRVLHQLFLEVAGFTFLVVAGIGVITGLREYGKYETGHAAGPGRLILAIAFTLSFAWFGLSSFWRLRRRRKA
jgi:hypothetical protein